MMRSRYSDNGLSLDQVARELATSERQLQRVFQEADSGGFRSTLRRVRMEAAQERIADNPALTVREIALLVGYTQPAQFAKAFRAQVGLSPSQYREQLAA